MKSIQTYIGKKIQIPMKTIENSKIVPTSTTREVTIKNVSFLQDKCGYVVTFDEDPHTSFLFTYDQLDNLVK